MRPGVSASLRLTVTDHICVIAAVAAVAVGPSIVGHCTSHVHTHTHSTIHLSLSHCHCVSHSTIRAPLPSSAAAVWTTAFVGRCATLRPPALVCCRSCSASPRYQMLQWLLDGCTPCVPQLIVDASVPVVCYLHLYNPADTPHPTSLHHDGLTHTSATPCLTPAPNS